MKTRAARRCTQAALSIALACYAILFPRNALAETPTFGTTVVNSAGLRGDLYFIPPGTTSLPNFDSMKPVGVIWTTRLNMRPRHWHRGFPGITKRHEWFAINYTGHIWIEQPGTYKFALLSDDGARLYIDDQLIIDDDGVHPPQARGMAVTLRGGLHSIRIAYFQGPRDWLALVLDVAKPGGKWTLFNTNDFKPPPNPDDWKYKGTPVPSGH